MATTATRTNYWFIKTVSTTTPVFNFKFVVEVYINSIKRATLVQPKNDSGAAHFNLERVIKNYIKATDSTSFPGTVSPISYTDVHLIPRNIPNPSASSTTDYNFSRNGGSYESVTLKYFEDYASSAGGTITRNASGQADQTYRFVNLANDWHDQKTFNDVPFIFTSAMAGTGKFLTKLPAKDYNDRYIYHEAGAGGFRTLACLNNSTDGSADYRMEYKFFVAEPDATLSNYRAIITAPVPDAASTGAAFDTKALLFNSAGYENVIKLRYFDLGNATFAPGSDKYYSVSAVAATSTATGTATLATDLKPGGLYKIISAGSTDFTLIGAANNLVGTTFYASAAGAGTGIAEIMSFTNRTVPLIFKVSDCNRYTSERTRRTICWKNKYGVWDYYLFDTTIISEA